ncbi:hypothetical protein E4T48_00448 [Aureobasidium sp. EXF-10727]|nr:hypothetical protein E4T48_00448 [Aureobasidium sp. EXF-10727]KAI4729710.1 hypothetical protein E4T49_02501 [Aureobasidium sp. EXF-10728]
MYTPTHLSPRLELRPKRVKAEHAIMDANRLVHRGDYPAALRLYNRLLDERCHPAYYLNRALCYVAMAQPHLAVNDALRAYMMAQSVIDATHSKGDVNDHVRRIDVHILTYTDDCADALAGKEEWCTAPSTMFDPKHQNFKLARMTVVEEELENQNVEKKVFTPSPFDLRHKALFRLVDALSRCGRGPAYNALHLLGDFLMTNTVGANKRTFQPFVRHELEALAKHVQDNLLDDVIEGNVSAADLRLTQTGFSLLSSAHYGFAERPINYNILNNCILTIDSDSIVHYEYKFGMPASLAANQDVFEGMVLFTESLPFVVSTANTPDQSELATVCDACGTDLQIPAPFILRVLVEEWKQAEAELEAKRNSRAARAARTKPSSVHHRRTAAVDTPLGTPPRSGLAGKEQDTKSELRVSQTEGRGYDEVQGGDSEDDWNSESSSDKTDTCSDHTAPATPLRGRTKSRPGIFETSDLQICRYGKEKQRENFAFCSVDCYELAEATYHDSICGSRIEDYLRKSMIQVEDPGLPSVDAQKLVLLLLVRTLGWAYATSTDPLDLPIIQLFMASPRHPSLKDESSIPWSFHNNVMRPYQMYQAMDGRGDPPKSVANPDYSDGTVINTIISLIWRHMVVSDRMLWTKTYDEDGYHEQTYPYSDKGHTDEDENTLFGRLYPLCDLVPLATKPEDANVELVDLGGSQIICLPIFTTRVDEGGSERCIKKGTRLILRSPAPRLATKEERATYAKVEDYGEGGTMTEAEKDESMLEGSDTEGEHQTEELEEECSGYVDEETYGADDEYMADAEFGFDEDDEEMMNF